MATSENIEMTVDIVEKSKYDKRLYRGIVLKNGLTALLISDPDATTSSASLSVAVGKFL